MNHLSVVFRVMVIAVLISSLPMVSAQTGPANPTACVSAISANTTWTRANSPVSICTGGATINAGATLTIQDSVVVQFANSSNDKFFVQGALVADGTATSPITFTNVSAAPGSWDGLWIDNTALSPAKADLNYVTLEYGGNNGSFGALLYADHASVKVNHSSFRNSPGNGIYATANTRFDIGSSSFTGNGLNAIHLTSPSRDINISGITASGNGSNAVRLSGQSPLPGHIRWGSPGIPYIVESLFGNQPGDVLTIDPGNIVEFTSAGFLSIGGALNAFGLPTAPITMTGTTKSPGSWRGLLGFGGTNPAVINLDYVTVEYAGSNNSGNIELQNAALIAHHSIFRYSQKNGVQFDSNSTGSISNSQIYGNQAYGLTNAVTSSAVLATNNWWGAANGPHSDLAACPVGSGDRVTAGVLFSPVLSSVGSQNSFPLSSAPTLTMTPRRWFAPADGVTRVFFDLTLLDGNGAPLPGRTVLLSSTLGHVVAGGITDAAGKTLAYLTSSTTGNAVVNASLDAGTACEGAQSPQAQITFTTAVSTVDLMPDDAASYQNSDIQVRPLPVVVGIPTTISARLTNPLNTPVTVDVSFDFAQSGIGLVFGPVKSFTGQVVPAHSSITLSTVWTPLVSGHYCFQVIYDITAVGGAQSLHPGGGNGKLKQFNVNAQQSTTSSQKKDTGLDKTRNSLNAVNKFVSKAYDNTITIPLAVANLEIGWDLDKADLIFRSLQGDPPRQDYTHIDTPLLMQLPPMVPGNGVSAQRAAAMNDVDAALAQANAYGVAAALAFDRSGGAAQAGDLNWESTQTGVMLEYNRLMGAELITATQKINHLLSVAASEGVSSWVISTNDVIAMQQKLVTQGFSQQQINDAHTVGLTDADIEALRQEIIAANPQDLAGDMVTAMQQIANDLYSLGLTLENPTVFNPGITVTGGHQPSSAPLATGNSMAQVYNTVSTVQVGNPLTQTQTIHITLRRIDLPADWSAAVTPSQVTLNPGQVITATIQVAAGSLIPQGARPRLAVEAYAGTQLLGGVTIDILIPYYAPFDGKLRVYLPGILRK